MHINSFWILLVTHEQRFAAAALFIGVIPAARFANTNMYLTPD